MSAEAKPFLLLLFSLVEFRFRSDSRAKDYGEDKKECANGGKCGELGILNAARTGY